MLSLTRRYSFSSAHRLCNPNFSEEENSQTFGPCANLHGHNYTLEVTVAGSPSPQTGMITNIIDLDRTVHTVILSEVDHKYLDQDVPFLKGVLSTVENVAQVLFDRLAPEIKAPATLYRVRLYESEGNWIDVVAKEVSIQ